MFSTVNPPRGKSLWPELPASSLAWFAGESTSNNSMIFPAVGVSWVIGVPPYHPLLDGIFHEINHPAMGVPHLWQPPICFYVFPTFWNCLWGTSHVTRHGWRKTTPRSFAATQLGGRLELVIFPVGWPAEKCYEISHIWDMIQEK